MYIQYLRLGPQMLKSHKSFTISRYNQNIILIEIESKWFRHCYQLIRTDHNSHIATARLANRSDPIKSLKYGISSNSSLIQSQILCNGWFSL